MTQAVKTKPAAQVDAAAPSGCRKITLPRPGSSRPVPGAAVAVVLDAGATPGTESTVVDVGNGDIIRAGAMADAVEAWLAEE